MKRKSFRIPYERMHFVWVTLHYDVHLEGICRVRGELHEFKTCLGARRMRCQVFPLSKAEKVRWLLRKWLFEFCVGKHWSYPQRSEGVRYRLRRPRWLWSAVQRAYYASKKLTARSGARQ